MGTPPTRGSAPMFGEPERPDLLDEQSQHPVAHGRIADRGALLRRDPYRDEFLDRAAVGRQHAQCPVPRVGDLDREFHDPLQDRIERQL